VDKDIDALFVSSTLEIGGSESKIVKIANCLSQLGYAISIAYLNPPDTLLRSIRAEVSVRHLERRGKYSFGSLARLHKQIGSRCRTVFSVNFYPLLYTVPAVKLFSHRRTELIGLVNTTDFLQDGRDWGRIYAPFLRRCDRIIFGCREQLTSWISRYNLPIDRSEHIYNGVDPTVFSPSVEFDRAKQFREEIGVPYDATLIGSVGRFAPEKNFEMAIEGVGRLAERGRCAYLVLIGDGRERQNLEREAKRRGLSDRIIMPGVLDDVRPAISAFDIFVLPSRAVETFSNAALEAMAMARPVVLSNIGGAAEMVEHDESGYLFEVGNVDMFTDILIRLYDLPAERDRIGHAARRRVEEHFSFQSMVCRYKAILDS
jgi:glycosyltransferase involved in cell wall biosynthesis